MKRKSVKIRMSTIAGLALFLMLGIACTGTLSTDLLEKGELEKVENIPLIEKLAERFDIDKDEIMDFMEELKEEKRTEMEKRFEESLDELVEEGEITVAQKEIILEKREEIRAFNEGIGDMKVDEAREAQREMKEEFEDWAEENDIELKYLFTKAANKQGKK